MFEIPSKVMKVCRILNEAGEDAYVVGGAVRDLLMGNRAQDFDIATTAIPQRVTELFSRVVPTGIDHGTVMVLLGDESFEVTTLRTEGGYQDGRRPDSVEFVSSIEEDLSRRDFTVNAVAWDPVNKRLHDPFDGRGDIERCLLRAVGTPEKRFSEDGLRIMRAARFTATLEFELEEKTRKAVGVAASTLASVSTERKRDELFKMLLARTPSLGFGVLAEEDVLCHVCPELLALKQEYRERYTRTLRRVDLCGPDLILRLWALVAEFKEPAGWLDTMMLDRNTRRSVVHLARFFPVDYSTLEEDASIRRMASSLGRDFIVLFLRAAGAWDAASGIDSERHRELSGRFEKVINDDTVLDIKGLAVDGREIMTELQATPGPWLGKVLEDLLELVLEYPEKNSKPELLMAAAGFLAARRG